MELTEDGSGTTVLYEAAFIESYMGVSQMKARSMTGTHYVFQTNVCGDSYSWCNMWLRGGGACRNTEVRTNAADLYEPALSRSQCVPLEMVPSSFDLTVMEGSARHR